jgi:hypothetical protein
MKAKQVFVSMRNSHGKKAKHSMHECGEGFIAHTPLIVLFEPRITTAAGMAKGNIRLGWCVWSYCI